MRRIVVNAHLSWGRLRRNQETPTGRLPEGPAQDDVEAAVAERDAMWRALAGLPRRQRAAVVLRYYEDLSDAEIGRTLGCSPATARSLTSRALQALRRRTPATVPIPGGQS